MTTIAQFRFFHFFRENPCASSPSASSPREEITGGSAIYTVACIVSGLVLGTIGSTLLIVAVQYMGCHPVLLGVGGGIYAPGAIVFLLPFIIQRVKQNTSSRSEAPPLTPEEAPPLKTPAEATRELFHSITPVGHVLVGVQESTTWVTGFSTQRSDKPEEADNPLDWHRISALEGIKVSMVGSRPFQETDTKFSFLIASDRSVHQVTLTHTAEEGMIDSEITHSWTSRSSLTKLAVGTGYWLVVEEGTTLWGYFDNCELPSGISGIQRKTPIRLPLSLPAGETISDLVSGSAHAFIQTSRGDTFGMSLDGSHPVMSLNSVLKMTAAAHMTMFLVQTLEGTRIFSSGSGLPRVNLCATSEISITPVEEGLFGNGTVTQIALGDNIGLAVVQEGDTEEVYVWNCVEATLFGRLKESDFAPRKIKFPSAYTEGAVVSIQAGRDHGLIVKGDNCFVIGCTCRKKITSLLDKGWLRHDQACGEEPRLLKNFHLATPL